MAMGTIKELGNQRLTEIVQEQLPHIDHEGFFVWTGTITEEQFVEILTAIKNDKCIEDALRFLGEKYGNNGHNISKLPMRTSAGYEINYPDRGDLTKFEVVEGMTMGPAIRYLGHILTYDKEGIEIRQGTIFDMHLKDADA
jgi:hypothetical protein